MEVCPEVWTGSNGRHAEFGDHSLGLFGTVLQVPVRVSGQPSATASGPSSMELEPSVELLLAPWDAWRSTGAADTVVRAMKLAPLALRASHLQSWRLWCPSHEGWSRRAYSLGYGHQTNRAMPQCWSPQPGLWHG